MKIKKFGIYATGYVLCSFYGCKDHTLNRTKGAEKMSDGFIRRVIQLVMESFPIDRGKKRDMLRRITGLKKKKEEQ